MLLNVNFAGISLDGKRFFYENMLRRAKNLPYELVWGQERTEYIISYCCPPNLARTIAETSEYAYAVDHDGVWAGLYGANKAKFTLQNGASFTLVQQTDYPYDGKLLFTVSESNGKPFVLHLRIPHWATNAEITVNGSTQQLSAGDAESYIAIHIDDPEDFVLSLDLHIAPRVTIGHSLIEETRNQGAIEYGPLVYCVETPDATVASLEDLLLPLQPEMRTMDYQIEGRHVTAIEAKLLQVQTDDEDRDKLYRTMQEPCTEEIPVRLIPYFAWDNRGTGEMMIWLPLAWRKA